MTKQITENFELILEGDENALAQIMALFESGELEEILGVPVLGIDAPVLSTAGVSTAQPFLTRLTQWFDGIFTPVWQMVDQLEPTRQLAPAHFSGSIKRGKRIDLISHQVNLIVSLKREDADKVIVNVQVSPASESPNLPPNLKLILLEKGETFGEVTSRSADQLIQYEVEANLGEEFAVKLALGEAEITENFVV